MTMKLQIDEQVTLSGQTVALYAYRSRGKVYKKDASWVYWKITSTNYRSYVTWIYYIDSKH